MLKTGSSSYLHQIIFDRKNVSSDKNKLKLFADMLLLNKAEARYFNVLSLVSKTNWSFFTVNEILNRFRPQKFRIKIEK